MFETPEQLANYINTISSDASEKFLKALSKYNEKFYLELEVYLKELEIGIGGTIKANIKNIKIINKIQNYFKATFSDDYNMSVKAFLSDFDYITIATNSYFRILDKTFNEGKNIYLFAIESAKKATLNSLTGAGLDAGLLNPVTELLNRNITTGGSYSDLLAVLRSKILGSDGNLPGFYKYSKQIATDSLNQYSRNYLDVISNDLGSFDWYYYSGSDIVTSRDFCVERSNKFWHISEIEKWCDTNWAGKIVGTNKSNIKTYLGGYNCGHQLIPVKKIAVPKSDLERIA